MDQNPTESTLRRRAARQGLTIKKSRSRNPERIDHGGFMLVDAQTGVVVVGAGSFPYSASLDDIAAFLD